MSRQRSVSARPPIQLCLFNFDYNIYIIKQIFSLRKEYSKRPSICISPVIRRDSFGSNIVSNNVVNGSDIGNVKRMSR